MKKAIVICSVIILTAVISISSSAENKNPELIVVKPATSQPAKEIPVEGSVDNGQYANPSPREQLYVFWLLGQVISYPIDKIESYVTKKLYSLEMPKLVPAAATNARPSVSPFDALNRREIPPAPPVQDPTNLPR
ncbi:MAG: hypothetical protein ACP5U1_04890 [Desulfomonilaceae bacterium]